MKPLVKRSNGYLDNIIQLFLSYRGNPTLEERKIYLLRLHQLWMIDIDYVHIYKLENPDREQSIWRAGQSLG